MSDSSREKSGWIHALAGIVGRALCVLLVAAGVYVALGWVALGAMYRHYGGSGHPPAPSAPNEVYVAVFLVALPVAALLVGAVCLRLWSRIARGRSGKEAEE